MRASRSVSFLSALTMMGGVLLLAVTQQAEAVPAFARQTGMACVSCHAGAFPALNSFGRAFRAQGYTMRGAAPLVEGEDLSIPADLKASLITKLRYKIDGETDGNRGLIQWPEEAALLIGGRASERVGFLLEAGLAGQAAEVELNADGADGSIPDGVISQAEVAAYLNGGTAEGGSDGNFLSFKTHFNVTDYVAAVLYTTDGLGVGYGMELMNTGLARSQRPIEFREFAAAQRLGNASGGATGLALVYHDNNLMVNYSHWAPSWGEVNANLLGGMAHYLRVNYFVFAGGWDLGFGANWMGGKVKVGKTDPAEEIHVASHGVDFQAMGELAARPAQLFVTYSKTPKSSATEENVYNTSTIHDKTAYGVTGKLGVTKDTSIYLGGASTDNGITKVNDVVAGLQYMLAQNMNLELYNVRNNGTDKTKDFTMLQLFAGF